MATQTTLYVPDIGDFQAVEVIEVLVNVGDRLNAEDSILTVESDKAALEIPATQGGVIQSLAVKVGDRVSQGDALLVLEALETEEETEKTAATDATPTPANAPQPPAATPSPSPPHRSSESPTQPINHTIDHAAFKKAYATPSVRKFARELGVDLSQVSGTGRKGRITQDDVQNFVKTTLNTPAPAPSTAPSTGKGIPAIPSVDFSQWGEVENVPLSRINKLSGEALQRSWLNIPHVTQFDQADITDLEAFRKTLNAEQSATDAPKITPLVFLMKAVVAALQAYPRFNSSLAVDGASLIQKHYYHIGIAVDTAEGLVVPVIRDVEQKSLLTLAAELQSISQKARAKQLKPADLQGGCFSISSLGSIGGTQFTPIINAPEVAILGAARASMQPVWDGEAFVPRLIQPLALSYDHRVIDGADAACFTGHLRQMLTDIRRLLV